MLTCPYCRGAFADLPSQAGQLVACPHCRNTLQLPAAEPDPLFVVSSPRRSYRKPRGEVAGLLAALLSFLLPGLGQLCQGRTGEGIGFLLSWICCPIIAVMYGIGGTLVTDSAAPLAIGILAACLTFPIWIWSVVDAAMW